MKTSVNDEEFMHKLEAMFSQNKSMGEMAEELDITRNQVAGLINSGRRHGYKFPMRPANFWKIKLKAKKGKQLSELAKYKLKEAGAKSARVKDAQYGSVAKRSGVVAKELGDLYALVKPKEVPPEGLPLLDMPNDGCRFPIGERDGIFLFCSQPQFIGSYCQKHIKVMWPKKYS